MTNEEINRVSRTLGNGEDKYYVYGLYDGDTIFYVGKGQGTRIFDHEKYAEQIVDEIESNNMLTESEKQKTIFNLEEKLKTIINAADLKRVIIKWGLTENEAFMCESTLINLLSFQNKSFLTNIANGHASKKEKESPLLGTKALLVDEFLKKCAPERVPIDHFKQRFVFVKVQDVLKDVKHIDDDIVYKATMGFWRLSIEKCRKANYVLALQNGVVVGIYHVNEQSWFYTKDINSINIPFSIESRRKDISRIRELQRDKNITDTLAKRVYFIKCDDDIEPEVFSLFNKEIYYTSNPTFLKQQNAHYSWNVNKNNYHL